MLCYVFLLLLSARDAGLGSAHMHIAHCICSPAPVVSFAIIIIIFTTTTISSSAAFFFIVIIYCAAAAVVCFVTPSHTTIRSGNSYSSSTSP